VIAIQGFSRPHPHKRSFIVMNEGKRQAPGLVPRMREPFARQGLNLIIRTASSRYEPYGMSDPDRLAERWGIERGFRDVRGEWQEAGADAIRRVAALLEGRSEPADRRDDPAVAPAHQGDGRRLWILAVQLYAARSGRNWGHGDFTDLLGLLRVASAAGAAGVGLNPLHALFSDRAEQASPYAPNSRNFLNPLYIDVEAAPGYESVSGDRDAIARLQAADVVQYRDVAVLKLAALRRAYRKFCGGVASEPMRAFEAFRAEMGEQLLRFACFETFRAQNAGVWWDWPPAFRKPDEASLRAYAANNHEEVGFHAYLQWVADGQLQACCRLGHELGLPIGLYLDLAVGVDPGGADAWIEQRTTLNGLSVGAPPDAYNPAGQNWGLTAFNPHGLVAERFEPLRRMLRSAMRHAGAIRIDHVLGLMRLYVIPNGAHARDGVYLRFPFASMMSVVAEESRRGSCIVVGEDLGTVPENFRETMHAWGLWSYLVMQFERDWDGSFRPPERYLQQALATFNTHDLPTYAGWVSGHDLAVKRGIGLDPGEGDEERARSRDALERAVGPLDGESGFERVTAFLAATPARLVSVAIEDVFGAREQMNIPGTVDEYPNWRIRWPVSLEQLQDDARLMRLSEAFARAGRSAKSSA
jgi:4-alpha-glucanotransferase